MCRCVRVCMRIDIVSTRTLMCRHRLSCIHTSSLTHSHKSALTFSLAPRSKKKLDHWMDFFSHTNFTSIIAPLSSIPNSDTHYAISDSQRKNPDLTHLYFIALVISSSCTVQLSPSSAPFFYCCLISLANYTHDSRTGGR